RGTAAARRLVRPPFRRAPRGRARPRPPRHAGGAQRAGAGAAPPQRRRARGLRRSARTVGSHVTRPNPILHPDDDPRLEIALQLATRFWALVKSGRAYSVGHVTYTSQLDNYIAL